jgi:hypothetical protein
MLECCGFTTSPRSLSQAKPARSCLTHQQYQRQPALFLCRKESKKNIQQSQMGSLQSATSLAQRDAGDLERQRACEHPHWWICECDSRIDAGRAWLSDLVIGAGDVDKIACRGAEGKSTSLVVSQHPHQGYVVIHSRLKLASFRVCCRRARCPVKN